MNRICIIDPTIRARIKEVVAHAEANVFSIEQIRLIMAGRLNPPGDDPKFVVLIPMGFRCVYSHENATATGRGVPPHHDQCEQAADHVAAAILERVLPPN